jgi:hypothetical protein
LGDAFFAVFVAFFFLALGPMPTQPSTVSTTFLIRLFFFVMCRSSKWEKLFIRLYPSGAQMKSSWFPMVVTGSVKPKWSYPRAIRPRLE